MHALATLLSTVIMLVDRDPLLGVDMMLRWQEVRSLVMIDIHLGLFIIIDTHNLFIGF